MEPFDASGAWWLPDEPESRFDAKLSYSYPQGAVLTPTSKRFMRVLMAKYGQKNGDSIEYSQGSAMHQVPIIVGKAGGREFSLLHCQLHAFGAEVGLVIEGKHFEQAEEAVFPAYSLSYSSLNEWGASGRLKGFMQECKDGRHYFQYSYEMPPSPTERRVIELKNARLEVVPSVSFSAAIRNQATLTERTEFRIVPKWGTTLSVIDIADHYANLLRNFMMLATWNHVKLLSVQGWFSANESTTRAKLFWRTKGTALETPEYTDELFTLADLGENADAILQAWENQYKQFVPFVRNFFAHRYASENYTEVRFLGYMQALEGFHKRQKPTFQPRKGQRNVRLIDRLLDLVNSLQRFSVSSKITGCNLNAFAQPLVDVRNELTHEADLNISWIELDTYTNKLELIILLLMYHSIGFPSDLVEQIAAQNVGFQKRMQ